MNSWAFSAASHCLPLTRFSAFRHREKQILAQYIVPWSYTCNLISLISSKREALGTCVKLSAAAAAIHRFIPLKCLNPRKSLGRWHFCPLSLPCSCFVRWTVSASTFNLQSLHLGKVLLFPISPLWLFQHPWWQPQQLGLPVLERSF